MEPQKLQITKSILRKKNKTVHIIFPDFKIHYKSSTNKIVWHWHKDRHTD